MHSPPTRPPNCRYDGTKMYKTHSRYDYACFKCGCDVSFYLDPAGTWKEARPVFKEQCEKHWNDKSRWTKEQLAYFNEE